jgi:hypothetical protein
VNIIPIGKKTDPSTWGPFPIRSGTSVDCEKIKKSFQKNTIKFQNKIKVDARTKARIGTINPTAKLEVNGDVKIGNTNPTATTCTAAQGGSTRYNNSSKTMEYCNESSWLPMGGGLSGSWHNMTASRSFNTAYTNSTGKTIIIGASSAGAANVYPEISAYVNGLWVGGSTTGPYTGATPHAAVSGVVVPTGASYSINCNIGSMTAWSEFY